MSNHKYQNDKGSQRPPGGQQINLPSGYVQNQIVSQPYGAQLKSLDGAGPQPSLQMKLPSHKQQVAQYYGAHQTRANRGKPGQHVGNVRIKQGPVQSLAKPQGRKPHQPLLQQQDIGGLNFMQNQPSQMVASQHLRQFNDPAPNLCDQLPSQSARARQELPNQLHLPHHSVSTTIINNNNINFYTATPGQVSQQVPIFPQNHGAIIEIITQGQSANQGTGHHAQHQLMPLRPCSGLTPGFSEDEPQDNLQKDSSNSQMFSGHAQQRKNTNNPKSARQTKSRPSGLRAGSQSQIGGNAKLRGPAPGQQRQKPSADPSHWLTPPQGPPEASSKKSWIPIENQRSQHPGDDHLTQSSKDQQQLGHQAQCRPYQEAEVDSGHSPYKVKIPSQQQKGGLGPRPSDAPRGPRLDHAGTFGSISQMIQNQQNEAAQRVSNQGNQKLGAVGQGHQSHKAAKGRKDANFPGLVPEQDEALQHEDDSQGSRHFGSSIERIDLRNETASFQAPSHHHHRQLKSAKPSDQEWCEAGAPRMRLKQPQLELSAFPKGDSKATNPDSRIAKPTIGSGYRTGLSPVYHPQFGQIHSQSMYALPLQSDVDELAQQERIRESGASIGAPKNSGHAGQGENSSSQRMGRRNSGQISGQSSQTLAVDGNSKRLLVQKQELKPQESKVSQLKLRPNIQINKRAAIQANGAQLYLGEPAAAQLEQLHSQSMWVDGAQSQRSRKDDNDGAEMPRYTTRSRQQAGLSLHVSIQERSSRLESKEVAGRRPTQDASAVHQDVWIEKKQQRGEHVNQTALQQSKFSGPLTHNSGAGGAGRGQVAESETHRSQSKPAKANVNGEEGGDSLKRQRSREVRQTEIDPSEFEKPYMNRRQESPHNQIPRSRQSGIECSNSKPGKVLRFNLPLGVIHERMDCKRQPRMIKGDGLASHCQSHQELLLPHAAEKLEHDSYDEAKARRIAAVTSQETSPVRHSARRLVPMKPESFEQLAAGIPRGGPVGSGAAHHGKQDERRQDHFVASPGYEYSGRLRSSRSQGGHHEPEEYGCYGPAQRSIPTQAGKAFPEPGNSARKARSECCEEDSLQPQSSGRVAMGKQAVNIRRIPGKDADASHLRADVEQNQPDLVLARPDYRRREDPDRQVSQRRRQAELSSADHRERHYPDRLARPRRKSKPRNQRAFDLLPREDSQDIEEIEREILNMEYEEPNTGPLGRLEYQEPSQQILGNIQMIDWQQPASRHSNNEGFVNGARVFEGANIAQLDGPTDAGWSLEGVIPDDARNVQAIGLNRDLEKTQRLFWSRDFDKDE